MRIGPWILVLGTLGCKGGDAGDAATGDTGAAEPDIITKEERPAHILSLIPTADVAAGKVLYETPPGCFECHQLDGSGTSQFPPLTERLPVIENPRLVQVMLDGIPAQPGGIAMPPYRSDWTDPQIAEVIAYIRQAFDPAR